MKTNEKIINRLEGFVAKVQAEIIANSMTSFSNLTPAIISFTEGSKFFKIVTSNFGSRSVYCFVDKSNGDIYRAATWKAPAKHVYGNIFDANYGWGTAVGVYGAN